MKGQQPGITHTTKTGVVWVTREYRALQSAEELSDDVAAAIEWAL
jgi:hypothetical protein